MIKFIFKSLHISPVYKVDILKYVKKHYKIFPGICLGIEQALYVFRVNSCVPKEIIPKLSLEYASKFSPKSNAINGGFWWKHDDWSGGRMDFLNWLISEYKDDKTDLRYV